MQRVKDVIGFPRSTMTFKYLSVPICSRRISAVHCDVLIEKMIRGIKVWSSRHLSYMARV